MICQAIMGSSSKFCYGIVGNTRGRGPGYPRLLYNHNSNVLWRQSIPQRINTGSLWTLLIPLAPYTTPDSLGKITQSGEGFKGVTLAPQKTRLPNPVIRD